MKIGFFTDSYLPMHDGVATSTYTFAEALKKRGHDVYIIAPKHPRYKDKEPNIYRLSSITFFAPEFRLALQIPQRSLLQTIKIDFDIIHGHNGGPISFLGWELSRAKNIPYVLTYHTMWSHYTHYLLNGKLIRPKVMEIASRIAGNRCDYLIAPVTSVKDELVSYGIKKPIHVLPSGIELTNFRNIAKGFIRKKLKILDDKKILLYVGRLGKEKSVDFLINAFQRIYAEDPDTVLVLVGSGSEKEKLRSLVKSLGLTKNVYFLGTVAHASIPQIYADADVFVFASESETQGMVIVEALASGIPVVSVKDEAFKGVIQNNKNGFVVSKDEELFAGKVLKLLNDQKLYKHFSQTASKSAEKFSIDESVSYLENIYDDMIKDKMAKAKKKPINFEEFRNFLIKAKTQIKSFEI